MHISPHLCFDGQCREAFERYQTILGGRVETMLTYGASPMASSIDPKWHEQIVHATLMLADVELTGVDLIDGSYRRPQGFFVTIGVEGVDRARDVFNSLRERGSIHLPFEATFWSPGFGVLTDRFGIPWEVNATASQPVA